MLIKNSFKASAVKSLSNQIFYLIKDEPKLTARSKKKIASWLTEGCLYVLFEENKLIGFVVREKLTSKYFEIKSWFIDSKYRDGGFGKQLLLQAISDEKSNYLAVTFQKGVIRRLEKWGFMKTPLTKLPLKVSLKYLLSRNLGSMVRHLLKTRSVILVKRCK